MFIHNCNFLNIQIVEYLISKVSFSKSILQPHSKQILIVKVL
ncbi:hypothetical protein JCM19300_1924 [Algibacter lectus]|uniref:Uncharacterized protein n=1 Tax=Algibacter lectus TaxID=221126 RepID=A0A090VFM9_9FLAO|nr:hypothetical protein JCM19300_1924 [Algibacter lectus]